MANLSDIVDDIHTSGSTGLTKDQITSTVKAFFSSTTRTLSTRGEVNIHGFGKFVTSKRNERMGRNPKTGEDKIIPASTVVKFRPSKTLKDAVA